MSKTNEQLFDMMDDLYNGFPPLRGGQLQHSLNNAFLVPPAASGQRNLDLETVSKVLEAEMQMLQDKV